MTLLSFRNVVRESRVTVVWTEILPPYGRQNDIVLTKDFHFTVVSFRTTRVLYRTDAKAGARQNTFGRFCDEKKGNEVDV